MEKIVFLAGIGGSVGGVCLLFYQGIMYLMHGEKISFTVLSLVDKMPDGVRDQIASSPQVANALESCPLYIALIVVGLILLSVGSWLKNRYV